MSEKLRSPTVAAVSAAAVSSDPETDRIVGKIEKQ